MYRVIVADDEPIALEHISSIIGKNVLSMRLSRRQKMERRLWKKWPGSIRIC